jgi:hypothetical protein
MVMLGTWVVIDTWGDDWMTWVMLGTWVVIDTCPKPHDFFRTAESRIIFQAIEKPYLTSCPLIGHI